MKTYAFFNVKGGASKTSSACTVAHLIATQYGKRVLLVDLDPQSNATNLFSVKEQDVLELIRDVFVNNDFSILKNHVYTVGDLMTDPTLDVREVIASTRYKNLDLLPAFLDLAETEEALKADIKRPQQQRLKAHLEKVEDEYDYCVLDCSPSISIININGLALADFVFTPIRVDAWGIAGYCMAHNLMETVKDYNPKLEHGGCFLTQYQANNRISKQLHSLLVQVLGDLFIDIPIRKCVKVEEMTYEHKALNEYAPNCTAEQDYRKLTKHIIEHF